jgi:hypothetical protein
VFSHWLLDLIVHRADMPFLPGNAGHLPRMGFGLWRHPAGAMTLELALVLAGAFLYWRSARATAISSGASGPETSAFCRVSGAGLRHRRAGNRLH